MIRARGRDGELLARFSTQVRAQDILTIDIKQLLGSRQLSAAQSVTVDYFGVFRTLAAQSVLSGFAHGGSVDAQLLEDKEFWSNELNAVWWGPPNTTAHVVLYNTSRMGQSVMVSFGGSDPQKVQIPSHGAISEEFESQNLSQAVGSLHIATSGEDGTLRALGFVAAPDGSYVNTLRFLDPGASLSDSLYATGLTIPGPNYVLALDNISPSPIVVTGKAFLRSNGKESPSPIDLKPVTLGPLALGQLRLGDSVDTALKDIVALELTSSAGKASLIAGLSVVYPTQASLSASVPFRDVTTEESSTGGYPWRVDGDYTTNVFLTNASREEKQVATWLALPDHRSYAFPSRKLQDGETAEFDLRDLYSKQISDQNGFVLPRGLQSGQFMWSIVATRSDEGGILGRAVMESLHDKTLRSYSCFNCTCGATIVGLSTDNATISNLAVGSTAAVNIYGKYGSPCGNIYVPPPVPVQPDFWENYNSGFNVVDGNPSFITAYTIGFDKLIAHYTGHPTMFYQGACNVTTTAITQVLNVSTRNVASRIPTYVPAIGSDINAPSTCPGGSGWYRKAIRQVQDQNGTAIAVAGQILQENLTTTSDGLQLGNFTTGGGTTDSSGQIRDTFAFCNATCKSNPNAVTYVTQQTSDTYANGNYSLQPTQLTYTCHGNYANGN